MSLRSRMPAGMSSGYVVGKALVGRVNQKLSVYIYSSVGLSLEMKSQPSEVLWDVWLSRVAGQQTK